MKRLLYLISMLTFGPGLHGGVDQGNPKRVIYNMANNYRVQIEPEWTVSQEAGGVIKLDAHLTYREDGFLVISAAEPEIPAGMQACGKQAAGASGAFAYWIGKDCANAYFARQFETLKSSVESLIFPNAVGGTR